MTSLKEYLQQVCTEAYENPDNALAEIYIVELEKYVLHNATDVKEAHALSHQEDMGWEKGFESAHGLMVRFLRGETK